MRSRPSSVRVILASLFVTGAAACNQPGSIPYEAPHRLTASVELPKLDGGTPVQPAPALWVGTDAVAVGADLDGTTAKKVEVLVGGYRTDGGVGVMVTLEQALREAGAVDRLVLFVDERIPMETLTWVLATTQAVGVRELELAVGTPDAARVVPLKVPAPDLVDPAAPFDWGFPADVELWWRRGTLLARAVPRGTALTPAPVPDALAEWPAPGPVPIDLGDRECAIPAPAGSPAPAEVEAVLERICGMPAQSYRLRLIPTELSTVASLASVLVAAEATEACKVEPILLLVPATSHPECRRPMPITDLPAHMKPPPPPLPKPEPVAIGALDEAAPIGLLGVLGAGDAADADLDTIFEGAALDADLAEALGGVDGVGSVGGTGVGGAASIGEIGGVGVLDEPD